MKRLILMAVAGAVALSGCIVAVERRDHPPRHYDPPPPPVEQATVTVAWNDARVVFLREYYGCDWDDVGCFDFYETRHGIPEDDLFVLFYIARHRNINFHEVVFTYESCGRNIFQVCRRTRFPVWDLYVDLPPGTWCPPAYRRCYGFYWRRDNGVILSNYDCHALFWLRFSVHYYGWTHHDVFTRWERCVSTGDRFTVVVHREYQFAGRGRYNIYQKPVVRVQERPERGGNIAVAMKQRREESVKKVEVDVNVRVQRGEKIARPPAAHEIREKEAERRRHFEQERENEKKELERTKHERPPPPKEKEKEREKDPPKREQPPREKEKEREKQPPPKEREKEREKQPPKEREKDPPKEREKEREKDPPKEKDKERQKDPPREKEKERQKDPPKEKEKERQKDPPKKDDRKDDRKKDDGDKKKDDGDNKKDDGSRKKGGGRSK
jgi:hypothetical protein